MEPLPLLGLVLLVLLALLCAVRLVRWTPPRAPAGGVFGRAARFLAASAVLLLAAAFCPGCRSPLEGGAGARFVEASRAAHDLWQPFVPAYFMADPSLTPFQKEQLVKSFEDWALALALAEDAIRPDMLPAPEVPSGVVR